MPATTRTSSASGQKNAAPPPALATGLVELEVWALAPNRNLLICHKPGEDGTNPMNLVSVQVRDNSTFLKKMRLQARQVAAKRFILEGPCPVGRFDKRFQPPKTKP